MTTTMIIKFPMILRAHLRFTSHIATRRYLSSSSSTAAAAAAASLNLPPLPSKSQLLEIYGTKSFKNFYRRETLIDGANQVASDEASSSSGPTTTTTTTTTSGRRSLNNTRVSLLLDQYAAKKIVTKGFYDVGSGGAKCDDFDSTPCTLATSSAAAAAPTTQKSRLDAVIMLGSCIGSILFQILSTEAEKILCIDSNHRVPPYLEKLNRATGNRIIPKTDLITNLNIREELDNIITILKDKKSEFRDLKSADKEKKKNIAIFINPTFSQTIPVLTHTLRTLFGKNYHISKSRNCQIQLVIIAHDNISQKICSYPNSEHRCSISALAENFGKFDILCSNPSSHFFPPNSASISTVACSLYDTPRIMADFDKIDSFIRMIFGVKKFTIIENFIGSTKTDKISNKQLKIENMLNNSGIDHRLHARSLNCSQIKALFYEMQEFEKTEPNFSLIGDFEKNKSAAGDDSCNNFFYK